MLSKSEERERRALSLSFLDIIDEPHFGSSVERRWADDEAEELSRRGCR